ncbi:cilia- and flagella-associated protein 61 [Hippocampus zosterae]|uniref:cilia- and flagella-associated protein 61 n=1 Tax=Hippocampus zosterae TaxID=109293 RepID=UPI00223C9739|nr:cilia- and flagella-associated protein 61 [Hippocampus zosterae]
MNNTITSSSGQVAKVTVRRSECSDAEAIENLLSPEALELFGPINVLQLLEKANLAVTLASEEGDVMAHASFFDHPVASLVDPPHWESFFCKHFKADALTPWNTLFIHLFVSQTAFSAASFQHIMSAVFNTTAELDFVCLLSSTSVRLDAALDELLEPLQRLTEEEKEEEEEEEEDEKDKAAAELMAFVCHRRRLCPRLHVRPARVEDHDDVMHIVAQQTKILSVLKRPYFLSELIEAQDENNHAAVCECDGTITGFISVTAKVDVRRLQEHFDLKHFGGLCKAEHDAGDADDSASHAEPHHPHEAEEPPQEPQPEPREEPESEGQQECQEEDEEVLSATSDETSGEPNAFCIQFFFSERNYEIRSLDLIPYIFQLFPDLDFCIITVPTISLDFPLLQNFLRVPPRPGSLLPSDLYILHRDGLRSVDVRPALESDRDGLADLVRRVRRGRVALLRDLDLLLDNQAPALGTRAHVDGSLTPTQAECPLQAFVADVDGILVGLLIIRDETNMEYIRARYNIENFIYFSHHGVQEHAQLRHFVLRRCFQHFSRHLFKETLRLARKSSLYHRVYPLGSGREDGCVDHLDFVLDCAVPVRPRRQIIYPLEELGFNAPARSITEEQAPFALNLISRKLTMEPKVTVNARIVLVGASDTGLSFLEVLCFCPHLRFNNLTLISTHGFPADYGPAGIKFLSTSHAYNSREMAQLPLRSCVAEVAAKMVAINRKSKHVVVSGGAKIPYDYLVLCTGLQYQVPCPTRVDQDQAETNEQRKEASFPPRYTGTVPSNFFTLNDPHDCNTARDWLLENFVRKSDNAVVYGKGLDVFTTVEMLLRMGVRGSCIHLVLTPPAGHVANDNPPPSDATDDTKDSPRETTVTSDSPPESDVTNDPPPESDVTNYSPRQSDVTSDSPRQSDETDDSPRTTTVANDSPCESDVTNDPPLESDVTHDSPRESDVANDSPRESDITDESPGESDNDSPGENDITNDPPPETDATTDPLAEIDVADDLPFESDVTSDSPLETDGTNDPPPEIDVTSDSPPEIDDSNDSPRAIDDTSESLSESDVTNESPPGSDVTQSSPPASDVADESAHRIGVAGSPALENGTSGDPPPDSGVADDPPPEPRVATDSPPKMISNEPPPEPRGVYFSDAGVESAVMAALEAAQVHIHRDCLLMQMNNGEHPDPLTSVSFSTGSEALQLSCGVFINLSSRGVDYDAFGSINSSFLVFDGRLVIDGAFRTNDAAIWGAGPLTKFSRSYYSDEWSHANFNSKEVGQELATMLLRHFDPTLEAHREIPGAADRLVPVYKRPKIQGGTLPGRLNYLCVTKPVASGPRGPSVACGRRIATGRPESGDYFCLHLDRNQVVETITCLSLQPLPVHNLMCLYGKHQQLLGQLLVRLQLRQIHDLYSFFRQSWCLAIFHDRFSDFEEELLQGDAKVDCEEPQGAAPRDLMKNPSSRAPLRINAAKYLSFNRNLLPMFTCPEDL